MVDEKNRGANLQLRASSQEEAVPIVTLVVAPNPENTEKALNSMTGAMGTLAKSTVRSGVWLSIIFEASERPRG